MFSFVGELEEPVNLSIASSTPASRRGSDDIGDCDWERALVFTWEIREAVGVFAGEDFVGEIDLARSGHRRSVMYTKLSCHIMFPTAKLE